MRGPGRLQPLLERIEQAVRAEAERFGPIGQMADILAAWPIAVGPEVARNAWPARLARGGVLHVTTSSSVWAFELGLAETRIRERLCAALGEGVPKAFRFAPGHVPDLPEEHDPVSRARSVQPSPDDRAQADRMAAPISSGELRASVARAIAASLARAASDRAL